MSEISKKKTSRPAGKTVMKPIEKQINRPAGKRPASRSRCPVSGKCGGCTMIDVPYEEQLQKKQQLVEDLIGSFGRVDPIIRMKNPDHYRNKVTSVFAPDKKGRPVCGIYKAGTHEVVPVKSCMLEDLQADRIRRTGSYRRSSRSWSPSRSGCTMRTGRQVSSAMSRSAPHAARSR